MSEATFSRRGFHQRTLSSLITYSLLETLCRHNLFAAEIEPIVARWVADVNQLGLDLKDQKLKQTQWQEKVEQLLTQVEVGDLLKFIDFDRLTESVKLADRGERSIRFSFPKVEGIPEELCFGKQIFGLKKGRSVVPHGHNNMATAFLILRGELHGRHYDRQQDEAKHMIVKPTIDRKFDVGECSTISDYKDNVHWFQALSEPAFIFNMHVMEVKPENDLPTGRVYIDPNGEKLDGGLIRARIIGYKEAHELYG